MPSKTEEYLALAQRTANGLTRYWESWTDYLTTASRLYKYPFADQLMIYAQRPDATACAEFDIWRNRMNRYVRRGSKGIALLDESSGFPRLHYVFDVSDTGVRRNSRDPEVWQYNDDLKQPVSEMLAATYGISGERVSQQLADVAGIAAFAGQALPVIGIAGGVHARCAVQGVHFQAGIIGNTHKAGQGRHGPGFDESIFFKCGAGFFDVADFRKGRKPQNFHAEFGQRVGQFANLARILRGQNDTKCLAVRHVCILYGFGQRTYPQVGRR